jgi:hypothetical protein
MLSIVLLWGHFFQVEGQDTASDVYSRFAHKLAVLRQSHLQLARPHGPNL